MRIQLLRTTTGFVPTKMEKMSPYFCERLMKERERFLTSRYGREPIQPRQGGPGGKLLGRIDAFKKVLLDFVDDEFLAIYTLMQKMTRMTKRAITMVHMMGLCNYLNLKIYYT